MKTLLEPAPQDIRFSPKIDNLIQLQNEVSAQQYQAWKVGALSLSCEQIAHGRQLEAAEVELADAPEPLRNYPNIETSIHEITEGFNIAVAAGVGFTAVSPQFTV